MQTPQINVAAIMALPPGPNRDKALQIVAGLREQLVENKLQLFVPYPAQTQFLEWEGHLTTSLFLGGNRAGKTTVGVVKDIIQLVPAELLPDHLRRFKFWHDVVRGRVVTADFKQSHEVIVDKFREWVPRQALAGKGRGKNWWKNAFDRDARRLWFDNGSFVEFMSQEQDVDAFSAQNLHFCHFDEEPPYDLGRKQFNECMMRLADHMGSMSLTMTPLDGMSWVHDQLYIPAINAKPGAERVKVVTASSDDNPHMPKESLEVLFASDGTQSAEEIKSRRHGLFVAFEGQIYPAWDPAEHVIPALAELPEIGPERRRTVVGIDPGAAHPAVVFLFADDQGRITVFDEIRFEKGAPIKQVCDEIKKRLLDWETSADWYVIDPSARNREQATAVPVAAEYAKHGIPCRPGVNTRAVGIGRIRVLLENPGYFRVTENCLTLRQEFPKYRWKGSKRSEDAAREQPVKRDDHYLDATRYAALSLPKPAVAKVEEKRPVLGWPSNLDREMGGSTGEMGNVFA